MFKLHRSIKFLVTFASLLASSAFAQSFPSSVDQIYVPDLDQYVHVKKNVATKEYSVDYRDLIQVGLKITSTYDLSVCKKWRDVIKDADPTTDASFYQGAPLHLRLQALNMNSSVLNKAFATGWSNITEVLFRNIQINYDWGNSSILTQAGNTALNSAKQAMENSVNSLNARQALNTTGQLDFTVTNTLFACDLLEGNVALSFKATLFQQSGFHSVGILKTKDLVQVSQRLQNSTALLKANDAAVLASDSLRALNAAGLLGFQLHLQGAGAEIFSNGEFYQLFNKIFEKGVDQPVALTDDSANQLVQSMAPLNVESENFELSNKLPLARGL